MQIKTKLSTLVLVGALATGCSGPDEPTAEDAANAITTAKDTANVITTAKDAANAIATAEDAANAIATAEAAQKKAGSVAGEWRDTGKMIKKAKAAEKKGDFKVAVMTAGKAQRQGEVGYEQAVSQKEFKMPSYLKY